MDKKDLLNEVIQLGKRTTEELRKVQAGTRMFWNTGRLWAKITGYPGGCEEEAIGRIGMVMGMTFDAGAGQGWCFKLGILAEERAKAQTERNGNGMGDGFYLRDNRPWVSRYWPARKLEFLHAQPLLPEMIGVVEQPGLVIEDGTQEEGLFHVVNSDKRHYLVDAKAWLGDMGGWKKDPV